MRSQKLKERVEARRDEKAQVIVHQKGDRLKVVERHRKYFDEAQRFGHTRIAGKPELAFYVLQPLD